MAISEVIAYVSRGDQETAARWLEGSFIASSPLLFAANDLRMISNALAKGATEVVIADSPMRYDWLYYSSAALKLGLAGRCSDERFRAAIREVELTRPTLNETGWLVQRYAQIKSRNITSLYRAILTEFRNCLANLKPAQAYEFLRNIAFDLADGQFPESKSEAAPGYGRSHMRFGGDGTLFTKLSGAYDAYGRGELDRAQHIAEEIVIISEEAIDPWSRIDAGHLVARVLFDKNQASDAEEKFLWILDRAQQISYEEAFVRALHEISRLKMEKCEVLEAEAGLRVALDYYTARAHQRNHGPDSIDPDDPDLKNLQVAINCLAGLAETYFLLSKGPTESVSLIDGLRSDFLKSTDDSGYDFLEIRGLALNLLTKPAEEFHTPSLIGTAMKLHACRSVLAMPALVEAEWVSSQRGVTYPTAINNILSQTDSFVLRECASYKPRAVWCEAGLPKLRHLEPNDAAESISSLYEYLSSLDNGGRYVYRGQVREYEGPLLPSAFRPIFRSPHPMNSSPLEAFGKAKRLRACGELFVGEYNECFQWYSDVMRNSREAGIGLAEIERNFSVYKKLLDDPTISLRQDREGFVPWRDAVRQVLSEDELEIYRRYRDEWNLRINNYHKRLFRENALVRLFGYALGTTFGQQYGFSSEGLDATKALDVACFFATHDSADFLTVEPEGIGIVYRFPFPENDVATRPLSQIGYYNLPSIIDVEDVFYRFEHATLDKEKSLALIRCYLAAVFTYGLESSELLLLPRDFLRSSRVHAQKAVIVVPDEFREDEPNRAPGPGGVTFPQYRFIEDLRSRPGLVRFYFKHTGHWPESLKAVSREKLWPRDDFLLQTLILLMASFYRLTQKIPKRLDLIDGGYAQDQFAAHCQALYEGFRPLSQFFTGYEQVARSLGVIS